MYIENEERKSRLKKKDFYLTNTGGIFLLSSTKTIRPNNILGHITADENNNYYA